jgi:hypothetical protein
MLVSTNVVEVNPAWSSATTYAKDALVHEGTVGVYQSLVNSNLNHQPSISPTQWVRIGPTNGRAMFDQTVSTQSASSSPIEVVIETGIIDSLALINLDANSVNVEVKDGSAGAVIYDETVSLISGVTDWYDYFFSEIEQETQVIFRNIPPYGSAYVTITVTGSGTIKVGECIFGRMKALGGTQYGASSGITDYSKKVTNDFGTTTLTQGNFSKRMNTSTYILNTDLNKVQKFLYSIRATPCVFIASDVSEFSEALIVYGFYKDFNTEIPYPTHSICNIEIEGLI